MALFKLFGYNHVSSSEQLPPEQKPLIRSFVNPENEDGAKDYGNHNLGGSFSYALDLDKSVTNQAALINEYRGTSQIPQVDMAVEDIVNEAIVIDDGSQPLELHLDDTTLSDNTKKIIMDEFDHVLGLLKFPMRSHDIFKRYYVDGQLNYHKMIDEKNPTEGIQELRFIDPRNLVKVREHQTTSSSNGIDYLSLKSTNYIEYWVYNESGFTNSPTTVGAQTTLTGVKIARDSIAHVNSGSIDPNSKLIMSHLHKAVRIARQLRMLEDSLIIYRISRAAERRIFYIDVGSLPKARAEQYMQSIIAKYKNKLVYDAGTGELRDERKHLAITEDFWIPRSNGQDGTKIETLKGAENLGIIADVEYFKNNLYDALNVPRSRMDSETMFSIGKSGETTRDEVKYSRFIDRLRTRFTILFDDLLSSQLKLKGIVNDDEWQVIRKKIKYKFNRDNHFAELMESELNLNRVTLLEQFDNYTGKYFSKEWIFKNILKLDDDQIEEIYEQIQEEMIMDNQMLLDDHLMKMKMGLVAPDPETGAAVPQFHQGGMNEAESDDLNNLLQTLKEETDARIESRKS
mgnify:CR=1 FL=1